MFFVCLLGAGGGLLILYVVLHLNSLWIYRLFDRATRNGRTSLSHSYELPRYFRLGTDGQVDTAVRWPGWDGWYFFVVPEDTRLPIKMIRGSVMTGLYGLSGVDDYTLLPAGVSQYQAAEHLVLVPTEESLTGEAGSRSRQNYLSHLYPPKTGLRISTSNLCVQLTCPGSRPGAPASYGSVEGQWPDYRFHFRAPECGLEIELAYRGQRLVWWADVPSVFTYFSAFGKFSGKAALARSAEGGTVEYEIEGRGGFEHGFARKPFSFDWLYAPVRGIQVLFPYFRPVRYHYEVLIGDGDLCGGWMRARGLGIDFRNRGGVHLNGEYVPVQSIAVEYLDPRENSGVSGSPRPGPTFYRCWRVQARTTAGPLEYVATHDWPPAPVATNMTYYNHSFEGTFRGRKIHGKGYGEYLHM